MEIDGGRLACPDEEGKIGHNAKGRSKFRLLSMAQHQRKLVMFGRCKETDINRVPESF
uniref:Alpha 3 protein n=1 Tax=Bovine ephemeral fever virus TaxID=11303 RepID=A0A3G6XPA9_BEFV|nr:alpha 3 protein [Bovine ephemeral fever virus]